MEEKIKENGSIDEDTCENFSQNCRFHIKEISYSFYCKLSKRE